MAERVPATARQLQDDREVLTTELAELAESICFCPADSVVDEHRFHYRHQLTGAVGEELSSARFIRPIMDDRNVAFRSAQTLLSALPSSIAEH
jgi:hypothetical protein